MRDPKVTDLLDWLNMNLLTDSQLDVCMPGTNTTLRALLPRVIRDERERQINNSWALNPERMGR